MVAGTLVQTWILDNFFISEPRVSSKVRGAALSGRGLTSLTTKKKREKEKEYKKIKRKNEEGKKRPQS